MDRAILQPMLYHLAGVLDTLGDRKGAIVNGYSEKYGWLYYAFFLLESKVSSVRKRGLLAFRKSKHDKIAIFQRMDFLIGGRKVSIYQHLEDMAHPRGLFSGAPVYKTFLYRRMRISYNCLDRYGEASIGYRTTVGVAEPVCVPLDASWKILYLDGYVGDIKKQYELKVYLHHYGRHLHLKVCDLTLILTNEQVRKYDGYTFPTEEDLYAFELAESCNSYGRFILVIEGMIDCCEHNDCECSMCVSGLAERQSSDDDTWEGDYGYGFN